jgi:hypothetical protein
MEIEEIERICLALPVALEISSKGALHSTQRNIPQAHRKFLDITMRMDQSGIVFGTDIRRFGMCGAPNISSFI